MAHGARTFISTSHFSKSYLTKAWAERERLRDYERRGLVQFIYLTICGHLEARIARAIQARLLLIRTLLPWNSLPPVQVNGQTHSVQPIADSVLSIIASIESDLASAPIGKLTEIYNRTFPSTLAAALGTELAADIQALSTLRNLFAHGRDLFVDFGSNLRQPTATLDRNPVQAAAQRLFRAGIIKDFEITGLNHHEWMGTLFSDAAVIYFYKAVQAAEAALDEANAFEPGRTMLQDNPLPALEE